VVRIAREKRQTAARSWLLRKGTKPQLRQNGSLVRLAIDNKTRTAHRPRSAHAKDVIEETGWCEYRGAAKGEHDLPCEVLPADRRRQYDEMSTLYTWGALSTHGFFWRCEGGAGAGAKAGAEASLSASSKLYDPRSSLAVPDLVDL
jgi:hypothetical protein